MSSRDVATDDASRGQAPNLSLARRVLGGAGFLAVAAAFVGLAGLGIAGLQLRAAAEAPRAVVAPVHVETLRVRIEDGYTRVVTYTGRLEAARQTALAFERGGLVVAVAKDEGQVPT